MIHPNHVAILGMATKQWSPTKKIFIQTPPQLQENFQVELKHIHLFTPISMSNKLLHHNTPSQALSPRISLLGHHLNPRVPQVGHLLSRTSS